MSPLTGSHQDAVAMENVQLKQMSTPPPISQFPGRTLHSVLVENTRCEFVCARAVDARAHRCMASEILNREEGEHFFKVTAKVGRFIVQPCVLVHT